VKITFLFFLLITHWCGAPASWATRHTTVCLDISEMLIIKYTGTPDVSNNVKFLSVRPSHPKLRQLIMYVPIIKGLCYHVVKSFM